MNLNFFNYKIFDNGEVLLTNDFGEYIFVRRDDIKKIVGHSLDVSSDLYKNLIEKGFVYEETALEFVNKNENKIREIKGYLASSTSLHIFVVTTACNMNCVYCQANSSKNDANHYMNKEIAVKATKIALESPSKHLSFEFQGGEPLLNFEVIKSIVEYAEENKGYHEISYNLVSNLTILTDDEISFLKEYGIGVSTSLDGSNRIHNKNRKFINGEGTFDIVKAAIDRLKSAGLHIGAIETTTRHGLNYPEEIVGTYVDLGFDSIFVRPLTPLGRALLNWDVIGYGPEEFVEFYKRVLNELILVNKQGYFIREDYACIFLERIFGNSVNYMELRSPCGAGVGQLAYYPDGKVYTCDEGRMVSETGDKSFCLGDVINSTYRDLIKNSVCKTVCASSVLESLPSCCDCVYQPFCGVCPVVNYALFGDVVENNPHGYRCRINEGIFDFYFTLLKNKDKDLLRIFEMWSN